MGAVYRVMNRPHPPLPVPAKLEERSSSAFGDAHLAIYNLGQHRPERPIHQGHIGWEEASMDVHQRRWARPEEGTTYPGHRIHEVDDVWIQSPHECSGAVPGPGLTPVACSNKMARYSRPAGDRTRPTIREHQVCGDVYGIERVSQGFADAQRSTRTSAIVVVDNCHTEWRPSNELAHMRGEQGTGVPSPSAVP